MPPSPTSDTLFQKILSLTPSLGSVLDSGTGPHSLTFLTSCLARGLCSHVDAVAYDDETIRRCGKFASPGKVELHKHDWSKSSKISTSKGGGTSKYDTVILDYLIGSTSSTSPFKSDVILRNVVDNVKKGGSVFVVGLEGQGGCGGKETGVLSDVVRVRDLCIMASG